MNKLNSNIINEKEYINFINNNNSLTSFQKKRINKLFYTFLHFKRRLFISLFL
jgi:hypothetical protein